MIKLRCAQAWQIDLINYFKSLGYQPKKIRRRDYWFCASFRDKKTASFEVNRSRNRRFDFEEGKGGNFCDFYVRFYRCSINRLLEELSQKQTFNFSFPPPYLAGEKKDEKSGKVLILDERCLSSKSLFECHQKRCIPVQIAEHFYSQVEFFLYCKKYIAIGFQNNGRGYELRIENFKGSSSPKDIVFIAYSNGKVAVFKSFFGFFSFQTINQDRIKILTNLPEQRENLLVLNSLFHSLKK